MRQVAVSRSKVYSLMDSGRLPHVKLGRSRRIRWEDVLRLVEENTVGVDGGEEYRFRLRNLSSLSPLRFY
jgi:excisionase family DNA binding protein